MKSDFDTHEGTLLLYPTRKDVWRRGAAPITQTVLNLARLISEHEPTFLGVPPELDRAPILRRVGRASVCKMLYDDIWTRDTGAVPCDNDLVKFGFNAWGGTEGLYSKWDKDNTVPEQMSALLNKSMRSSTLVLEGGNLLTNGRGTLIAISQTICNDNRNIGLSVGEAEDELKRALGVRKIIWIEKGLVFDETGGHIDNLCAFANPSTILLAWTDDPENYQYSVVREAYDVLSRSRGANGEIFNIVKVPLPNAFRRTLEDCEGLESVSGSKARLPDEIIQPSYINFIFVNGAVILPVFEDEADLTVQQLFSQIFKDRKIIPFPAREIVLGGGGLHCITKNF